MSSALSAVKEALTSNIQRSGIYFAFVLIIAFFAWRTDGLSLGPENLTNLVLQYSYILILAIGMVLVIIAGHIDLSVGSVVALVGAVSAVVVVREGMPWWVGVLAGLAVGAVIGAWQGFWVAYVGIPAFIVTLGGMLIFRGLAIVLVGVTLAGFEPGFVAISNGSVRNFLGYIAGRDVVTLTLGAIVVAALVLTQLRARATLRKHELQTEPLPALIIKLGLFALLVGFFTWVLAGSRGGTPIVLLIVGVLIVVYSFVTQRTVFGRNVYAMGGNLQAAILSGVNTKRMNFLIFVNIGLLASVAGVVTTSKAGAAVANAGNMYELDAIAACFIGGTSVYGGIGRVSGVIVGALVMGVLNMGLSIIGTDPAWQSVIKGLVLLVAVAFDLINKRRSGATVR